MAVCLDCKQEMTESVTCIAPEYEIAGKLYARVPNGPDRCHDCAAPPGGLHHPGCDAERCPICGGQAISCGCGREDDEDEIEWEVPF